MAFVGLRIPPETARLLAEIDVPGNREAPSSYHITLLFIGNNIPVQTLAKALMATEMVTSRTRPFTVATNRVTCFPKNDDGCPIICKIDSDPLYDLQAQLAQAYDQAGIEYSKKYDYNPHVTLAYGEEEIEEQRISKLEWGAHEVVLWGGDSGDNRLTISFPLTLNSSPPLSEKVAARYMEGLRAVGKSQARRRSRA